MPAPSPAATARPPVACRRRRRLSGCRRHAATALVAQRISCATGSCGGHGAPPHRVSSRDRACSSAENPVIRNRLPSESQGECRDTAGRVLAPRHHLTVRSCSSPGSGASRRTISNGASVKSDARSAGSVSVASEARGFGGRFFSRLCVQPRRATFLPKRASIDTVCGCGVRLATRRWSPPSSLTARVSTARGSLDWLGMSWPSFHSMRSAKTW